MPLLSIVTVCFNSETTIGDTLESIASQTFQDFEYIIIDGGSTDSTLKIINSYKNIVTTLVSERDDGIYDAMNKGLSAASGRWIHIINSDDYYYNENSLARAIPHLTDENKFYYFTMFQQFENARKEYRWDSALWKLWYSAYIPHPTMIVSNKSYQKIGNFDIDFKIAADHDLTLRLIQNNFMPVYNDVPFSVMRMGGFSGHSFQKTFLDHMRVTIKNGFPRSLAFIYYILKVSRKRLFS